MSDIQDTSFLSRVYKLLKVLFVSRDEDCFLVQVKRLVHSYERQRLRLRVRLRQIATCL